MLKFKHLMPRNIFMKHSLLLAAFLSTTAIHAQQQDAPQGEVPLVQETLPASVTSQEPLLKQDQEIRISVVGQGVAPTQTVSPAQAYALAKRAAIADGYRLIAERVKGVRIDGQDLIQNMMVKRSSVRTSVDAMVQNANVVETVFKEGLCEVEMEVTLSYTDFVH